MSQVEYYRTQAFAPSERLQESQTASVPTYLRAYRENDAIARAERMTRTGVAEVIYYNQTWPNPSLVKRHSEIYPGLPMRVWTKPVDMPAGRQLSVIQLDSEGEVVSITRRTVDGEGDPIVEDEYGPDGKRQRTRRYEYRDGSLSRVVEAGPDGVERVEYDEDD